jgi:hypothetical protein
VVVVATEPKMLGNDSPKQRTP